MKNLPIQQKPKPSLGSQSMYDHKDGVGLRKMHKGDLFALLSLKQESWWGTHQTLISNIEDQQRWYESIPASQLFMIAMKDNEPIGVSVYTDIDWVNRSLNIGGSIYVTYRKDYELVKAAFSCGLDFGFEMLNMRRMGAEVLEFHAAAHKLEVGHLGFKLEGRRRKAVYKCGKYYDSICLGLLRDEWEQQDRIKAYGEDGCNMNFNTIRADKLAERLNQDLEEVVVFE